MQDHQGDRYAEHDGATSDSPDPIPEPMTPSGPRHATRRSTGRSKPSRFFRPRSVRAKIVAVLMVPVVSLMALWGFAAVTTTQSIAAVQQLKDVNATLLAPIGDFITAVQDERTAAAQLLASDEVPQDGFLAAAEQTDAAVAALRDSVARSSTDAAALDSRLPERIQSLVDAADYVTTIRSRVRDRNVSWLAAYDAYTNTIRSGFSATTLLAELEAPGVATDLRFALELSLAREMVARQDAVMSSAYAIDVMTQAQYVALTESIQAGQALLWTGIDDLRPGANAEYRDIIASTSHQTLRGFQDELSEGRAGYLIVLTIPEIEWAAVARDVQRELAVGEARVSIIAAEEAALFGFDVLGSSGLAVMLGLVGVVLALLVSVLVGRGLVVDLAGLHGRAMDLATRKLPATLRKLNSGRKVDLESEAPAATYGDDEVSQVAEALGVVHRAAVHAAIERSDVLRGISGVYVFLARRSQVLLHRQLALLDTMERRTDDAEQLEDLFRLDHLTTRMRRLTESLVILSGMTPARRWSKPVAVMDVVRAAVAEVEDFTRVEVMQLPHIRVAGAAVADLIHLVAELVENAVVFSPPHTKALVRGELVGAGMALEVEDRGLGMSPEAMEQANRRIKDTDQIDLLEADQLGLFVVNRLAQRHNIDVTLRRSPYGGVTAILLIPEELLEKPGELEGHPSDEVQVAEEPAPEYRQLTTVGTRFAVSDDAPGPRQAPAEPASRFAHIMPAQQRPEGRPEGMDELPRRVRLTNLSPELRRAPNAAAGSAEQKETRSPEQARATFSALRNGWLRGQSDNLDNSWQGRQDR
ncbi:MAG TPA: nitrate- and nitrite sensing domain-containing protein [Jiangellaceae bacterium]